MSSLRDLATDHCITQVRLFQLAPLYACGCTRTSFFTDLPPTEILKSNCTMILALGFQVQLKTLITLPNVPSTSNCFPSLFIRYLLALLTILLSLDLVIGLGMKNWFML